MRKEFRKLAVVLIAVMFFTLCEACGNTETVSKDNSQKTSVQATQSTQTVEPIKITVKNQNDGPQDPKSPVTQEINKRFNVQIEYVYIDRSKDTELMNMKIASGEIPDVMLLSSNLYSAYAKQGALAELKEDVFKQNAPKLYDETIKFGESKIYSHYSIDGKLWGIPMLTPDGNVGYVPIWRDDWLKNVGIDKIPETVAEAEQAFYKFVNNDPDKNGKKDTYALSNNGINAIFDAYGGYPFGYWTLKDGKVSHCAVMPEMKEALQLLSKWYKDGLIDPEFITKENKGQYWANSVAFWNGKIGFSLPGVYYHVSPPLYSGDAGSGNYQSFKKLQPKGTYKEGMPLKGPSGKMMVHKWSSVMGSAVSMGKQVADDPQKMQKILQIFEATNNDQSVRDLVVCGIKGVTYEIDSNGLISVKSEIRADTTKLANYAIDADGLGFLNNNMDLVLTSRYYRSEILDYKKKYSLACDEFLNPIWAGLPSDGQYKAVISKKVEQVYDEFITGQKSLNEWDNFVKDLNNSGLTQLTTEANAWYNK